MWVALKSLMLLMPASRREAIARARRLQHNTQWTSSIALALQHLWVELDLLLLDMLPSFQVRSKCPRAAPALRKRQQCQNRQHDIGMMLQQHSFEHFLKLLVQACKAQGTQKKLLSRRGRAVLTPLTCCR